MIFVILFTLISYYFATLGYISYNTLLVCSEGKYYPSKTKESLENTIPVLLNIF